MAFKPRSLVTSDEGRHKPSIRSVPLNPAKRVKSSVYRLQKRVQGPYGYVAQDLLLLQFLEIGPQLPQGIQFLTKSDVLAGRAAPLLESERPALTNEGSQGRVQEIRRQHLGRQALTVRFPVPSQHAAGE